MYSYGDGFDRYMKFSKDNNEKNKIELQNIIRERMFNFLNASPLNTQKLISTNTGIPSNILTKWKYNKPDGYELWNGSVGQILLFLEDRGF